MLIPVSPASYGTLSDGGIMAGCLHSLTLGTDCD